MNKNTPKTTRRDYWAKLGRMILMECLDDIARDCLKDPEIGPRIRAVHRKHGAPLMECARYFVRCSLRMA